MQYSWVFLLHQKSLRELGKAETLLTAMSWCQLCLEKAHPRKMLAPAYMLWDKEQGLVTVTCFCRLLVESIWPDRKSTCGFFCSPFWFKKKCGFCLKRSGCEQQSLIDSVTTKLLTQDIVQRYNCESSWGLQVLYHFLLLVSHKWKFRCKRSAILVLMVESNVPAKFRGQICDH